MNNPGGRENLSGNEENSPVDNGWGEEYQNSVPEFRGEANSETESRLDYTVDADSAELRRDTSDSREAEKRTSNAARIAFVAKNSVKLRTNLLKKNGVENIKQLKSMSEEDYSSLRSKIETALKGEKDSDVEYSTEQPVEQSNTEAVENKPIDVKARGEFFSKNRDALKASGIENMGQLKKMSEEDYSALVGKISGVNTEAAPAEDVKVEEVKAEAVAEEEKPDFVENASERSKEEDAVRSEILKGLTANSDVALQTIRLGGVRTRAELEAMSTDGLKRLGALVLGEEAMKDIAPERKYKLKEESSEANSEEEKSPVEKEVATYLELPRGKRYQSLFAMYGNRLEEKGITKIGQLKALGEDGFKDLVTELATERYGDKSEGDQSEVHIDIPEEYENNPSQEVTSLPDIESTVEGMPAPEESANEVDDENKKIENEVDRLLAMDRGERCNTLFAENQQRLNELGYFNAASIENLPDERLNELMTQLISEKILGWKIENEGDDDFEFIREDEPAKAEAPAEELSNEEKIANEVKRLYEMSRGDMCNSLFAENQQRLNELGYFNVESMVNLPDNRLDELVTKLVSEKILGEKIEDEGDDDFVFVREGEPAKAEEEKTPEAEADEAEKAKKVERRAFLANNREIMAALGYKTNGEIDKISDDRFNELKQKVERAAAVHQGEVWNIPEAKAPTDVGMSDMWTPQERYVAENLDIVNKAVEAWNGYSDAERRLMLSGQFDSFGTTAAGRVSQLMNLVEAGYFNAPAHIDMPVERVEETPNVAQDLGGMEPDTNAAENAA